MGGKGERRRAIERKPPPVQVWDAPAPVLHWFLDDIQFAFRFDDGTRHFSTSDKSNRGGWQIVFKGTITRGITPTKKRGGRDRRAGQGNAVKGG